MNFTYRSTLAALESVFPHPIPSDHSSDLQPLVAQLLRTFSAASVIPQISKEDISLIAHLSVFHDIGKQMIPATILNKPGKLSPEEYSQMKTHTMKGGKLLESIPGLRQSPVFDLLYDICCHHHERWDGKGYPDSLFGSQITPYVHVIGLADVYDALRTARPYKLPLSHEEAVSLICSGACGTFDPAMLDCFSRCMKNAPPLSYKEVSKVG